MSERTRHPGLGWEELDDGQIWGLTLDSPPANILDAGKIGALTEILREARTSPDLKVIVLGAKGANFSFGASVEEHLPGAFEAMIPAFHGLFRAYFEAEVPCLAAVRGLCLGGALELVTPCQRLWSAPEASFGQPEANLGVFAPVASLLLADRVGHARAEELCVSGRILGAEEGYRIGLVDVIDEDPTAAAFDYAREHLLPKSASSLRLAVRAARLGHQGSLAAGLDAVERLYLETLMSTADAIEGLEAFVEKRPPQWRNR